MQPDTYRDADTINDIRGGNAGVYVGGHNDIPFTLPGTCYIPGTYVEELRFYRITGHIVFYLITDSCIVLV